MNKEKILRSLLYVGAAYYIVGAVAHYFALTIFPWFDAGLYAPYQDTVIAFVALVFAYLLVIIAKDPLKNRDILKAVMVAASAASVFSIVVVWKVDFAALGAPAKATQTVVEGILGFLWVAALAWAYRKER